MAGSEIRRKISECFSGLVCRLQRRGICYPHHISLSCNNFPDLFRVSSLEWTLLVFAIGFVFVTETLNTAIEIDIDLTSSRISSFCSRYKRCSRRRSSVVRDYGCCCRFGCLFAKNFLRIQPS